MSDDQLLSLIHHIVPASRNQERLEASLEKACIDKLNAKGQGRGYDLPAIQESIKRQLTRKPPPTSTPEVAVQRFQNLKSRLLEQRLLTRPESSLTFLYALARTSSPAPSLPSLHVSAPSQPANGIKVVKGHGLVELPARPALLTKSKAELLREYRNKIGKPELPEYLLLRDALYLLQGISGKYIRFEDADAEEMKALIFDEDSKYIIPEPTRELIYRLSELGHLYSRVSTFVREKDTRAGVGLIEQSLCHHLQSQLTEYYRLVAILESQMSGHSADDTLQPASEGSGDGDSGLTLRRLEVWIEDWRLRMRMMSTCVEGCKTEIGGALVSLIHGYTDNGDPFVRKFTDELLEEVSKPFFATLHRWLYSGDLRDPFQEFFVGLDPQLADLQYVPAMTSLDLDGGLDLDPEERKGRGEHGLRLWKGKYRFRKDMLPRFVDEGFGKKIFSTGKSLNFIRFSCHDSDWVATRNKLNNSGKVLKYSDISGLEQSIDTAYQIASQRLFDIFFEKFKLLDHLKALKNYLLLGHGDFASSLMEALGPSLRHPANILMRHNLTGTLETAVRSTNAQYDPPDVLRRLDARLLEYSHGEIGWDVFTLEYKIDAPVDTVLDPDSMRKYLKLFNHLWRMRRVFEALTGAWTRLTSETRLFQRIPEMGKTIHFCRIKTAEMIFFLRQVQSYWQSLVIAKQWKGLMEFVSKKEGDLDSLIQEHKTYLDNLVVKIFMFGGKSGKDDYMLTLMRDAFSNMLQFRDAVESLYKYCMDETARRDAVKDRFRGVHTTADHLYKTQDASHFQQSVKIAGTKTSELIKVIVLGLTSHHDTDCRDLGNLLSFNEFSGYRKDTSAKQNREATTV